MCIQPSASIASAVLSGWFQYPFMTEYPRVHSSPISPRCITSPVIGSTTWLSRCGIVRPTLSVRWAIVSTLRVIVDTGEVSVMP